MHSESPALGRTLYRLMLWSMPACVVPSLCIGFWWLSERFGWLSKDGGASVFEPVWVVCSVIATLSIGWLDGNLRQSVVARKVSPTRHAVWFFLIQLPLLLIVGFVILTVLRNISR